MSRIVNHNTKGIAQTLAQDYLRLLPKYTGSDFHWFHENATGFNDTTNVKMEHLEGFIDDFLQIMTYTVSKDTFEGWDNAGRFAACMTGDQLNHNVFTGFLTPLYTDSQSGSEYGTAVICAADKDVNDRLYEDINRIKLMTYKREPGQAPELLADLSAMIESDTTPRMFDRSMAPINGTVFSVLSTKFENDYAPQLEPTKGQVLTNRVTGDAADPSEVKRNVNEHFTHLLEKFSRRLDTLNNPNMIDPEYQTFWIEPVIEEGRRMFQIVDNEGQEQLDKPSAHRGEVFALCIRMNHEAGDEDEG